MSTATANPVIYGREIAVSVGSLVFVDGRNIGERLMAGDEAFPGWAGCQFRYPSRHFAAGLACNIKVVGRTYQRKHDGLCVRVQIEWVRDGEENETCGGWLMVE
jgi:hypothetical protein